MLAEHCKASQKLHSNETSDFLTKSLKQIYAVKNDLVSCRTGEIWMSRLSVSCLGTHLHLVLTCNLLYVIWIMTSDHWTITLTP